MLPESTQKLLRPAGYGGFEVDPNAVATHLSAFRLIDVRQPEEYNGPLAHIAGSELIPLATVPDALASADRHRPLLMICRSGARSGNATAFLTQQGFETVVNLAGGMLAWNEAALPVER